MVMHVDLPEPDFMETDVTLTEEQQEVIKAEKEVDWDSPKEPAKEDEEDKSEKESEETPDEEEADNKDESDEESNEESKDESEDTTEDQDGEEKQEAEAKAKEAEEAEAKRLDEKAKELGKTVDEVKQLEADEKAEQEKLESIAKDEGVTVEEAKELVAKDKTVAERHSNDPIKLARALRKEQSEYGKLKNEHDELVAFKERTEEQQKQLNEEVFNAKAEKSRDDIIENYRKHFSREAEELSDDACFERGKSLIKDALRKKADAYKKEVADKAKSRRETLIKELPEEYKEFAPELKTMLADYGDRQVLDKEFDIEYLANYVRGKKFTPDYIKSLEDAAYKRGSERPKIIPPVKKSKPSSSKKESVPALSETQKERAVEIYGRREGWSKERMYQEYAKSDINNDF